MNLSYPTVYIILLNWNGWQDTVECLESIFRLKNVQYIVVVCDNNSQDNSSKNIKKWANNFFKVHDNLNDNLASFQKAIPYTTYNCSTSDNISYLGTGNQAPLVLIQNNKNLGFTGGNNIGIQYAIENNAEYIWILNNDTIVESNCLNIMLNVAESSEDIGIVGSKIYFADNQKTIWFAGARFFRHLGKSVMLGYGEEDNMQTWEGNVDADFITGCSMLIKASVIENVGNLDNDFFFTVEDLDFSLRCQMHEFRCVVARQAKLWHKVSASTGGIISPLYSYYYIRNRLLLMKKHGKTSDWLTFLPYFLISHILKYLIPSFCRKPSVKLLFSTYYAVRDFYLGIFGQIPDDVYTKIMNP